MAERTGTSRSASSRERTLPLRLCRSHSVHRHRPARVTVDAREIGLAERQANQSVPRLRCHGPKRRPVLLAALCCTARGEPRHNGASPAESAMEPDMQTVKVGLESAFVERQRQHLLRLRADLLAAARGAESDEADVRADSAGEALEFEDDAQRLDTLERDGNLAVRDVQRLERVDRALKKIEEGTYGLSDISGQPIPRERLEAVPEALYTLSEEERRERPTVG
jgi:DnaK suppressor protein